MCVHHSVIVLWMPAIFNFCLWQTVIIRSLFFKRKKLQSKWTIVIIKKFSHFYIYIYCCIYLPKYLLIIFLKGVGNHIYLCILVYISYRIIMNNNSTPLWLISNILNNFELRLVFFLIFTRLKWTIEHTFFRMTTWRLNWLELTADVYVGVLKNRKISMNNYTNAQTLNLFCKLLLVKYFKY